MPVYHKHKLVHIHIPKTAGTAIEKYFHDIGDMKWNPESWFGQEKKNSRWYEYQHLSVEELRSLANSTFEGYTSFAVVRNPYSRMVSDYVWRQSIQKRNPHSPTQFFDTFDAFLRAIPKNINTHWADHVRDADKTWANFLIHTRPQYQYILDPARRSLVDEILKFEHLRTEITRLLNRCGLHINPIGLGSTRDIREDYTRAQLDMINEIYAEDFNHFGYVMA